MRPKSYRHYPEELKLEIARTGNIKLFPDLNIPRTTALYWKQNPSHFHLIDSNSLYDDQIHSLEQELKKERSLRALVVKVKKIYPFNFQKKQLQSRAKKNEILNAITKAKKAGCELKSCLHSIELSKSTYYRWMTECNHCNLQNGKCVRKNANQLTEQEVQKIFFFVTATKYLYMSIASLHIFAQRIGELFCSLDSWYKYTKLFNWERPRKKLRKKKYKEGIRAQKSNQIWHIDVTQFSLAGGVVGYLQAVIDNFSRYILSWTVATSIGGLDTAKNLVRAAERAKQFGLFGKSTLVMDGGKENTADIVVETAQGENIRTLIAQVDIIQSNSMIEAFFKSLKNNYLYHQVPKTFSEFKRRVEFYIKQHNTIIPYKALSGATPEEALLGWWGVEQMDELKKKRKEAQRNRRMQRQVACGNCS